MLPHWGASQKRMKRPRTDCVRNFKKTVTGPVAVVGLCIWMILNRWQQNLLWVSIDRFSKLTHSAISLSFPLSLCWWPSFLMMNHVLKLLKHEKKLCWCVAAKYCFDYFFSRIQLNVSFYPTDKEIEIYDRLLDLIQLASGPKNKLDLPPKL